MLSVPSQPLASLGPSDGDVPLVGRVQGITLGTTGFVERLYRTQPRVSGNSLVFLGFGAGVVLFGLGAVAPLVGVNRVTVVLGEVVV
jgi:hypothetical protein